ncbi:MAG: hypothetical protein RLZ98_3352 [Pseudomonadota bacterium]|jgi:cell division protein FtsW
MRISRDDRSTLAEWWFSVDRVVLLVALVLTGIGLVLSLASSPAVALKKGLPAFHFVERQMIFAVLGGAVMLGVSLLNPRQARRLALGLFMVSVFLMAALLVFGDEVNGARRWIRFAGFSMQPSEFAKPAFVVLSAWALSEHSSRQDVPAFGLAVIFYVLFVALLALQPDMGQAVLITAVWGALFLLSGHSLLLLAGFGVVAVAGLAAGYMAFDHVRWRIDSFLSSSPNMYSQTEQAYRSFVEGGFFGRGPGEGTIKTVLPDAHTDFIFAVVAEEYGVLACLGILALFVLLTFRCLWRAAHLRNLFQQFAVVGLALSIGLQAFVNMAVNVGLLPAKGMTLPLVSAGGSSFIGISVTLGLLLALMRADFVREYMNSPGLVATPEGVEGGKGRVGTGAS